MKFTWNHENTLLLLDAYEKRISQFRDPKVKKKNLWLDIAKEMAKYGYSIDADNLDKKMRNMRSTYSKILDNNRTKTTTGRGRISWQYFSRFEQIFATDKCIKPTRIVGSMVYPNDVDNSSESHASVESVSVLCTEVNRPLTLNLHQNSAYPSSSSSPSPQSTPTTCENNRWKRLDIFRKRQLEIEQNKLDEIKEIRGQLEEYNKIQRKKLELFEKYLTK